MPSLPREPTPTTLLPPRPQAADGALKGIEQHYADVEPPPAIAGAHYTLAGFYTYHHRRSPEFSDALDKAQQHLDQVRDRA